MPGRADAASSRLVSSLRSLPGVRAVRGLGLILAVELEPPAEAATVARQALGEGLVVNAVTSSAIRLEPPLTVSDEEIDEAVAILAKVLGSR